MNKPKDETGNKYGKLTVIRRATEEEYPRGTGKGAKWYCKCDCGNYTFADGRELRNGKRVSCGCSSREKAVELARQLGEKNRSDLTGKKFGKLTVLSLNNNYTKGQGVMWDCLCDCGAITTVRSGYLISGHTQSCGCGRKFGRGQMSKGECKIANILKKERITFRREYSFSDLTYKGTYLRYDFAIFKDKQLKCLLEFDGRQHTEWVKFFQPTLSDFKHMQANDRRKNEYALKNNIPLYRIPYWDIDNVNILTDLLRPQYRVKSKFHNDDLIVKRLNFK